MIISKYRQEPHPSDFGCRSTPLTAESALLNERFWRYDRQVKFAPLGPAGQETLRDATVLIVGCGALGSTAADQLARAGLGSLRLIDRDVVELHNLQRQPLFVESDAAIEAPKAVAAERALRAANSEIRIEGIVADFNHTNALCYCRGCDLILDGTDNFEARLLINDVSLETGIPWVYGGAVGSRGVVKAVIPGATSCLRCLLDEPPAPGLSPTCETEGIIAPAPHVVASFQVAIAMRLLAGERVDGGMLLLDAWEPSARRVAVPRLPDCPACVCGLRDFLGGERAARAASMCSSDLVQILPREARSIDLAELAAKLAGLDLELRSHYLLVRIGGLRVSVFSDGRVLVRGTGDPARARAAAARVLGG